MSGPLAVLEVGRGF